MPVLVSEHTLVPPVLRWGLAAARILLAGAFLYLSTGHAAPATAAAFFFLMGCAAVLAKSLRAAPLQPMLLFFDFCFLGLFLGLVSSPAVFWLSQAWVLYLLLSAALSHRWPHALLLGSGAAVLLAWLRPDGWIALASSCVGFTALGTMAAWLKELYAERLYSVSRQSVLYRSNAEKARQEERDRIANDFHDGPLQAFMSVQMRLEVVRQLLLKNQGAGLKELLELQDLLKSQVAELRAFLRSMRPMEVESAELIAALSRLANSFQNDTGISVIFSGAAALKDQPPGTALEILQIVREALHNVRKHSQATCVAVAVESNQEDLTITVDDNGSGFLFSGKFTLDELELLRLGPGSIKRRVRALNGEMTIDSTPGRGAGLRIRIPQ
ncbi:MAG: sensor histidine kinase [Acidobacteriia bacterium]|nr:sensor histidine kinase [Terriglobia bacterium]